MQMHLVFARKLICIEADWLPVIATTDYERATDAPLPTAGGGEVPIHVLASSVEYTDVLIQRHLYPQTAARRDTMLSEKSISSAMACAAFGLAIAWPI